jgi:hypothetical protein
MVDLKVQTVDLSVLVALLHKFAGENFVVALA